MTQGSGISSPHQFWDPMILRVDELWKKIVRSVIPFQTSRPWKIQIQTWEPIAPNHKRKITRAKFVVGHLSEKDVFFSKFVVVFFFFDLQNLGEDFYWFLPG